MFSREIQVSEKSLESACFFVVADTCVFCRRRIMRVSCALVNRDFFFKKVRQQFFDFIRLRFRLDFLGCEFMERARFLSDEMASRVLTYSCCTESPTKARTSGFISSASAFVIIVVRKGMVSCIRPIISHRSGFNKKNRIDLLTRLV